MLNEFVSHSGKAFPINLAMLLFSRPLKHALLHRP